MLYPNDGQSCIFFFLSISAHSQQWCDPHQVKVIGDLTGFTLNESIKNPEKDVYILQLELTASQPTALPAFTVRWNIASQAIYTIWDNRFNSGRSNYNLTMHSRVGANLALLSYIDKTDHNRMTFGVSDNLNTLVIQNRLSKEGAHFYVSVDFFKDKPPNLDEPGPKKSYSLSHLSAYEKEKYVVIKLLVIRRLSIASVTSQYLQVAF